MTKEKISYEDAVREIELILADIEGGTLGVDELAEKVERVTELLKICRERLYRTEQKIGKILGEEDKPPSGDPAPPHEQAAPDEPVEPDESGTPTG